MNQSSYNRQLFGMYLGNNRTDSGELSQAQSGSAITISIQNTSTKIRRLIFAGMQPSAAQVMLLIVSDIASYSVSRTAQHTSAMQQSAASATTFLPVMQGRIYENLNATIDNPWVFELLWLPGHYLHFRFGGSITGTQKYRYVWEEVR